MTNLQPEYSENFDWKDKHYLTELYHSGDLTGLSPVNKIHAVCLTKDGEVVLHRHVDGWLGLIGGTVEEGETVEQTLKREVEEEVGGTVEKYSIVGYEKYTNRESGKITYLAIAWAEVSLGRAINDPAKKSLGIELVRPTEVAERLGWGKRAEFFVNWAVAGYNKNK